MAGDIVGGLVEAAVPGPLVHDAKIRELAAHHGHAVFGEHRHAQLVDEVGNGVVHRGVHMVGTAGKDDADEVLFFDFRKNPFRFLVQFAAVGFFRRLSGVNGGFDFTARNAQGLEEFLQPAENGLGVKGQEWMVQLGLVPGKHFVHVGLDVFRIGSHHGAVVAVGAAFIGALVDAGVPDEVHVLFGQVVHMGMGQLGREAFGIGWNGFHGFRRNVPELLAGKHDPVAQFRKEGMPEGIVFIHVHGAGNAYGAPLGVFRGQGAAMPDLIVFPAVNVWQCGVGGRLAGEHDGSAPFAAVAGDEGAAVVESGEGNHAVIAAAGAALHFIGIGKGFQFLRRHQGGYMAFGAGVLRNEGDAVGSHEACHIGTDDMAVQQFFQRPEHGVVVEGAALHYHLISQVRRLAEADNLVEGIFDDGVGKAGGNICHGYAVLLGLPDPGVHEYGAAGAKVHRMGGFQGNAGKLLDIHAQGLGKGVQEGTAAGGAGLVQENVIHGAVLNAAAFHVLSADIQNGGHVGKEMLGAPVVGHGFHFSHVRLQGPFDELFAVACDTGTGNGDPFRQFAVQVGENLFRPCQRCALVAAVIFVQNAALFVQKHRLDGGGAGVNAQPYGTFCFGNITPGRMEAAVPLCKFPVFLFVGKKGRQGFGSAKVHVLCIFHFGEPAVQIHGTVVAGGHGGADGYIQFPVLRHNHVFICNVQGFLETLTQHGLEGEGTAEEGHFAVDRTAAGEARNGLVYHGLENGQGNILMGNAFVQKGLDIGLCKYTAAGGNGINPLCPGSQLPQSCRIHGKEGSHAVDKGTGAAGAGSVHSLVHAVPKIGDFFIFPAQFDNHVGVGMEGLNRLRFRQNFLAERKTHELGQPHAAAAGNGSGDAVT